LNGEDRVRTRVAEYAEDQRLDDWRRKCDICDRVVWQEGKTMWDIGCVVASMLFFVIAIGYAMGCDRLGAKETQR
jgi:hypothetical protein